MRKKKISFSPFQASQTREGILDMVLKNPELFEQMPGITAGQREAYEQKKKRVQVA